MYSKETNNIKITATPIYIEEQSAPHSQQYVWAYHIVIENMGTEIIQLISRYWKITDANGNVQEVRGPGVVGEQPVIRPGEFYEYTSGTHLKTDSGIMEGKYYMQYLNGQPVEVDIPAFSLDMPSSNVILH